MYNKPQVIYVKYLSVIGLVFCVSNNSLLNVFCATSPKRDTVLCILEKLEHQRKVIEVETVGMSNNK